MPIKISVVTPSYNQGRYLEETLRSVISQRNLIHEYFVFDGGSTDESVDLIKKYASGIDYWESQKDEGQSHAIEKGFTRATGDVLCWLNSDDVFLPGMLREIHAAFEKHPEWDCLTAWHVHMDQDSRILNMWRIPRESPVAARWGVIHPNQQTWFIRRDLYKRIGGIRRDLHCVMDGWMWTRAFELNAKWGHIPKVLAGFRKHPLAKGSAWLTEYASESEILYQQFPAYFSNSFKHFVGLNFYRLMQIVSGRYLMAKLETFKNRGKKLEEVFGEWEIPGIQPGGLVTPASSKQSDPAGRR